MDRIGSDDVKLLPRGEHVVPRVVVDDRHVLVVRHAVVGIVEILRNDLRDQRFHLADHHALYSGMDADRTGGDAGAEAHHQHLLRVVVHQRRKMTQQALQPHVLRFSAGFHLAAYVKVAVSARFFCDGDGGVHALTPFQSIGRSLPGQ